MTDRLSRSLACLLALCMLLPGCGKRSSSGRTEIVYFTRATPDQLEVWRQATKEFMRLNPDVKVRFENLPYAQYWDNLQTMNDAGDAPDIIYMESSRFAKFASSGAIENLQPYIQRDGDVDLPDFYPAALDSYRWKGDIYGLPNDIAIGVVFWNKDLFDEAGVPYPLALDPSGKPGWTWNDYLKASKMLTFDFDEDGRIDQYGTLTGDWRHFVWQNRGEVVDNPANPARSTMNTPAVREALQWLVDLRFKHHVTPQPGEFADMGGYEMFMTGKVAMVFGGHWDVPTYSKITRFRWDVAPLPKGKVRANNAYGSCLSIPSKSRHKEAAWRYIKFLAGAKGQEIMVGSDFSTPARRSIARSKYFLQPPPDSEQVFVNEIPFGHPVPLTTKYLEMQLIYTEEMDLMWLGKRSVGETCRVIDRRIEKVLQRQ
ncbi:MAG TPA: sugar ABC transporter substrate-binding protein [Armatimonadota bacterium]|nr:sugar ABC transporter substrate-binding protein [Armatimonadota bacterium]